LIIQCYVFVGFFGFYATCEALFIGFDWCC
jgi:hypothetical protein